MAGPLGQDLYPPPEYRSQLLKEFGFKEEVREQAIPPPGPSSYGHTGFPEPEKAYRLSLEEYDMSLEEAYYWMLQYLQETFGQNVEKLEDSFAAAENSAFFGVTQQRLGAQQDKVSQFLATTGKMIKELFQMVRELRIIDERLEYYDEVGRQFFKPLEQRSKSGEITLKGMFVDLVQGGGKSAASVYGMARELEFITLPDLFFDAPPFKTTEELDAHVKGMEANFNRHVIRVLQRHLRQYMEWRKRTHQEHVNRRRFQLAYLRQHFDIIQMYIDWVKPYLRHIARLQMKDKNLNAPEVIGAFESSMLDIELMGYRREEGVNGVFLVTYMMRTRPEMKVVQEGYQRGPVHIGWFEMHMRVYGWTDEEMNNYRKLKRKENMMLMGEVSTSVQKAMESLGEELEKYLTEARGDWREKKEEGQPVKKSLLEKMFGDFYTSKEIKQKQEGGKEKIDSRQQQKREETKAALVKYVTRNGYEMYKNFKKAHKMTHW